MSPISYGVNANIYPGATAMSATKITKPTAFVLFAPAQASGTTVSFSGWANSFPGVTVLGVGSSTATSNPGGGNAIGGTQNNRQRINALFADLHCETLAWGTFTNIGVTNDDPVAPFVGLLKLVVYSGLWKFTAPTSLSCTNRVRFD